MLKSSFQMIDSQKVKIKVLSQQIALREGQMKRIYTINQFDLIKKIKAVLDEAYEY